MRSLLIEGSEIDPPVSFFATPNLTGDQSELAVLISALKGLFDAENAVASHLVQLHFHRRISQGTLAVLDRHVQT